MSGDDLVLAGFAVVAAVGFAAVVALFRRRQGRPWTVWAGNAALLVALAGALSLGAEIYYRFLHDGTDAYHVTKTSLRWTERHYRTNNLGVRDEIDYALRPDGRRRVTFFGDSFANGHGVVDPGDRLSNLLRDRHPDWEVHLFARDGLDTGPLLDWVDRLTTAGYRFETVVYVATPNDISDLSERWQRAAATLYDEPPPYLVRHSFAINTFYYRWRIAGDPELTAYFDRLLEAYEGETWERQAARLRALRAKVVDAGGALRVVTFPFFEARGNPRYRAVHRRLDRFWAAEGVPHLDLLPVYADHATAELVVNDHDSHPNPFAHRLAADAVEEWLLGHDAEAEASASRRRAVSAVGPSGATARNFSSSSISVSVRPWVLAKKARA